MNPETLVILITGAAGMFVGALLGSAAMSLMAGRAARRAEKHAWAAANLYYSRKGKES